MAECAPPKGHCRVRTHAVVDSFIGSPAGVFPPSHCVIPPRTNNRAPSPKTHTHAPARALSSWFFKGTQRPHPAQRASVVAHALANDRGHCLLPRPSRKEKMMGRREREKKKLRCREKNKSSGYVQVTKKCNKLKLNYARCTRKTKDTFNYLKLITLSMRTQDEKKEKKMHTVKILDQQHLQ